MSVVELEDFYTAEYRRLYQGSEGPVIKDLAVQTQRARALLAFIHPFLGGNKSEGKGGQQGRFHSRPSDYRFLDVGCSAGKLLEFFMQTYGSQVVGIEPGEAYRREDQRRGVNVYPSLEELERSGPGPFDLISLIHVLEHIPNPVQYLSHLRQKLMRTDGWLLLEVPNLYAHDCFEVAHLTSFSAHTLSQVVKQAGFEIVKLKKHGAPRSRLLPLYLTLLAQPAQQSNQQPVAPEHSVHLKRRIGMFRRKVVSRLALP